MQVLVESIVYCTCIKDYDTLATPPSAKHSSDFMRALQLVLGEANSKVAAGLYVVLVLGTSTLACCEVHSLGICCSMFLASATPLKHL